MSRQLRGVLILLTVALSVVGAHWYFAWGSRAPATAAPVHHHEQGCPCGQH